MEVDGAGPSSAKATKRGTWQKIVNALGEEEKQEDAEESRKKFLQWRNECRKAQRKHQNDLVQKLDAALPKSALRQVRIKQGAGARALGTGGRSMHQALENVVEYMKELRAAGNLPVKRVAASAEVSTAKFHRDALMNAKSVFVLEVQSASDWIILDVGQGAADFFCGAPWGDMKGQSLANFVRCEDLTSLHKLWPQNARSTARPRFSVVEKGCKDGSCNDGSCNDGSSSNGRRCGEMGPARGTKRARAGGEDAREMESQVHDVL